MVRTLARLLRLSYFAVAACGLLIIYAKKIEENEIKVGAAHVPVTIVVVVIVVLKTLFVVSNAFWVVEKNLLMIK